MIIPINENKIIFRDNRLNESLIDDFDEFDSELVDTLTADIVKDHEKTTILPKVELVLKMLSVENYEIKCTGNGILVDVHDNLYLPNKGLNNFSFSLFKFDVVDGSCNYSQNNLTDWSFFPRVILGNCYANLNNIKNFDGAPYVNGKMVASKQNKKTSYPLTDEVYKKIRSNRLSENSVYAIPANRFGSLCYINENTNTCIVKFEDNTKKLFKLSDIEYIGNLVDLIV